MTDVNQPNNEPTDDEILSEMPESPDTDSSENGDEDEELDENPVDDEDTDE